MNALQSCRGFDSRDRGFAHRQIFNLLVVVVCALAAGVQPLAAATLVHPPYLQNMGADHVTIVWSARENQGATVQYSTDVSFSHTVIAVATPFLSAQTGMGITFYQYRADLTGLSANTTYNYRPLMGGQPADSNTPSSNYVFKTPGTGPFTFLVFGDSGDGSSHQVAVGLQMAKEKPNFVIHVGDIAYESGTYQEFTDHYFTTYPTLMRTVPFFPIAGNHEYYTDNSSPYLALSALPPNGTQEKGRYYSFDWANVHFVGLDANLLDPGLQNTSLGPAQARMLAWMENDLSSSQATWKIAFWHQTPYPVYHHIDDPIDIAAHDLLVPILERHGVQLVLTGHEHNYTRSKSLRGDVPVPDGTVYITTGGGGSASLHPVVPKDFLVQEAEIWEYLRVTVDGPTITVQTIEVDDPSLSNFIRDNPNGKEFDRVVLTNLKPPALQTNSVVNGADFLPTLASGGLVSIFGRNLAYGISQALSFPLPLSLGSSTVSLNGTPMSLTFASPSQINAALPMDALGAGNLRVTTPAGFAEAPVNITDSAPAIFASAITHGDGSLVTNEAPANPGETLTIYMTGLGQVDGKLAPGQAAPSSPLLNVLAPVVVQFDTTPVAPSFAGLAPGFVGVYQVNVVVPQSLPAKIYPVRVSVKGNASNSLNIQVQARVP